MMTQMRKPPTGIGTIVGCAAFLFLLTITAHAAEKYKVIEIPTGQRLIADSFTGVAICPNSVNFSLAWLDNYRLLLSGFTPLPPTVRPHHSEKGESGLYIWDTHTGAVSRHGDGMEFCYADGRIYVEVKYEKDNSTGKSVKSYRWGDFGREVSGECRFDGKAFTGCIGPELNLSLKPPEYSRPPLGPQSWLLANLRSGDGAIIADPSTRNRPRDATKEQIIEMSRRPIRLVNQDYPQGRELPIQEVERINSAAYSEFAKKYILLPIAPKNGKVGVINTSWPEGLRQPVYMLDRNGDVEVVAIPNPRAREKGHGTWIRHALPTQAGIIFYDGNNPTLGGGLFIYDGKQVTTIDVGQVRALAVTPDGCKAAWAIINDYGRGLLDHRIKYMNVCQGGH